jgi:hypothetical protein
MPHHVTPQQEFRYTFCYDVLCALEDETFTTTIMFRDETPFHLLGHVNSHKVRIVESNNPHAVADGTTREGPNRKAFCTLTKKAAFRPSFSPKTM